MGQWYWHRLDHQRLELFLTKINLAITGCWIWNAGTDKRGYPRFQQGYGHRWAYLFFIGEIKKPQLHHLCENKLCVNPTHLLPVTQKEHEALHPVVWCKKGHLLSETRNSRGYCRICRNEYARTHRNIEYQKVYQARYRKHFLKEY